MSNIQHDGLNHMRPLTFIMRSTKKVLHHLVKVRCWILTHLRKSVRLLGSQS
jgi:hypothetical protein